MPIPGLVETWISAFAGMTEKEVGVVTSKPFAPIPIVIPAKAGIHDDVSTAKTPRRRGIDPWRLGVLAFPRALDPGFRRDDDREETDLE